LKIQGLMNTAADGGVGVWLSASKLTRAIRLGVTGSSMFPAVRPGDVLTIQPLGGSPVESGQIILWVRAGRLFAHRVIGFKNGRPITQGDTLVAPDGPVAEAEIVGRVTHIERLGRLVKPGREVSVIARLCRHEIFRRGFMRLWALRLKLACIGRARGFGWS